jgi:dTDP-4-amino-4,6-dideoxygalactose transaminase
VGYNFRMTSIAAAIGEVHLAQLPEFIERLRENAEHLSEALAVVIVTAHTEVTRINWDRFDDLVIVDGHNVVYLTAKQNINSI